MTPTRRVRKALAVPSRIDRVTHRRQTRDAGNHGDSRGSQRSLNHGFDLLADVEVLEFSRDKNRRRNIGVELDKIAKHGLLMVNMSDLPDHSNVCHEYHQSVRLSVLRNGGAPKHVARRFPEK